jgi:hypothetical protein
MAGRVFKSGASRDTDEGKLDLEAFNSPIVDRRYGEFMHKNRTQPNGEVRSGDNWQLGITKDAYVKSGLRHALDWRLVHRGYEPVDKTDIEDILCAVIFNASGYLFEVLKARNYGRPDLDKT